MMARAAQTHQAGHMRPAGRVFETPGLYTEVTKSLTPSNYGRDVINRLPLNCIVPFTQALTEIHCIVKVITVLTTRVQ